ncbi:MAG: NAD(P)H-dependent glycerol-3-phosphate dehydrogenase [Chitinophagales bacterium]|nr:NAD(P)-dependent glycerol-3-phosphate dehydrogenase [Bacteroidota bacterium]MCB9044397.1 NAD(P)-dependent glycerol-3-phosphate dehydrogenase [Chitinophagales bacterium]
MEKVGVIGAGSFGTAIANLLAKNNDVLQYVRRAEQAEEINVKRFNKKQNIEDNVIATTDIKQLAENTTLIYAMVDSGNFSSMMKTLSPHLNPAHIIIHGTKGLNVLLPEGKTLAEMQLLSRQQIRTMTEVIQEESVIIRTGALSGPNLALELAQGFPAATVVSSYFDEVINLGRSSLHSANFRVYSSYDVIGVELAGVLKNIFAIASGIIYGLELGENTRAMLLSRSLGEMVRLGRALGAHTEAFYGIAGIGDLIATCASTKSRNFNVGYQLALGNSLKDILSNLDEVAEGIRTTKIAYCLSNFYKCETPIINAMHAILYEEKPIKDSIGELLLHKHSADADFVSIFE